MQIPVLDKLKIDTLQSSNEKTNEEIVMLGFRGEAIQFSIVKYQDKYFVILGGAETRWRPKP